MIKDYITIARPLQWVKNLAFVPGIVLAAFSSKIPAASFLMKALYGGVSLCLISSANYVINDFCDASSDIHNRLKKHKPEVLRRLSVRQIYFFYMALATAGLLMAMSVSMKFFWVSIFYCMMGIVYNVRPFRSKDIPFLDVLSESVNNPIRLLCGWYIVTEQTTPAVSLLLGYWMGGAFLMGSKRLAEYRMIADRKSLSLYRKSFSVYTHKNLFVSVLCYGIGALALFAVFFIQYKIELLLCMPLLGYWSLRLFLTGLEKGSRMVSPELVFINRENVILSISFALCVYAFLGVRLPWLRSLFGG
ncbi:MAG: UbiA family prenyltransferase [Candidatus Omnitrophica bacterium]|nr:UbiA family prenyltransferase [Candidatus Omnitrophota bacterium]